MAGNQPAVSVIIPVLNAVRYVDACCGALAGMTAEPGAFDVIVVDNGSTDATLDRVRSYAGRLDLRISEHPGVSIAALRNVGAQQARAGIFAFLDMDCVVSREWLQHGCRVLTASGERIGIAGAAYNIPADSRWVGRAWQLNKSNVPVDGAVSWLPSGNLFITRAAFTAVGGFNAALETNEDYDLCQRVRAQGFVVMSDRSIAVVHLGTPQTVRGFYGKQRWHGRDVFRVFRASGRQFKNLKAVCFALFYLAASAGLLASLGIGLLAGRWLPSIVFLAAVAGVPVALALKTCVGSTEKRDCAGLAVLYLVYGVARAGCIIEEYLGFLHSGKKKAKGVVQ